MVRYSPNRDLKTPMWPRNTTVEQLLAATCHIGHNTSLVHPFMKSFIAGTFDSIHIINLDYTLAHLRRAYSIVREISFRQGIILILGSRKGQKPIVVKSAERMGGYILYRRWIPGLITNAMSVLGRGRVKNVDTPFPHFANQEVLEKWREQGLFPNGEMLKKVFDWEKEEWIETFDSNPEFRDWKGVLRDPQGRLVRYIRDSQTDSPGDSPAEHRATRRSKTVTTTPSPVPQDQVRARILRDARRRGDLQEWMAWDKFSTIVSDLSTPAYASLTQPQKSFSVSSLPASVRKALRVEPASDPIPDQSTGWYERQLQREQQAWQARREAEASGTYRKPEEIHALDEFLERNKVGGHVRGEYAVDRVKQLKISGLKGYTGVKVFRDGSTVVGDVRFDRKERRCEVFPDGSYVMDGETYDRDGMRYDATTHSLVFSDGSMLKFEKTAGKGRWLAVVIGNEAYDVSSAVAGSAAKREILEKAEDLIRWRAKQKGLDDVSDETLDETPWIDGQQGLEDVSGETSSATPWIDGLVANSQGSTPASPIEASTTTPASPSHVNESSETSNASPESVTTATTTQEPVSATIVEPPSPLKRITPKDTSEVLNVLRATANEVLYGPVLGKESRVSKDQLEDIDPTDEDDFTLVKGSQLIDMVDAEEAESIDRVVGIANQLPPKEEATFEAEAIMERDPTPFKDMFSREMGTVRPDLVIVLNPRENRLALREATENQVPTIGIIDTDTDPRCVTYSIPANDDSLRSVEYIMGVLGRAGEEGLMHRLTYTRNRNLLLNRAASMIKEAKAEFKAVVDHMESANANANGKQPESDKAKAKVSDLTAEDVKTKYCEWYNLDPRKGHWPLIQKLIRQHQVLAQNEIRRLQQDTSTWSLQQHMDLVKTSLRFPNVPRGMMEELAHTRATGDRHEWADATEAVARQHAMMASRAKRAFSRGSDGVDRVDS
jgi:ribosomal protein S2